MNDLLVEKGLEFLDLHQLNQWLLKEMEKIASNPIEAETEGVGEEQNDSIHLSTDERRYVKLGIAIEGKTLEPINVDQLLKNNLELADRQRVQEKSKGFKIITGDIPAKLMDHDLKGEAREINGKQIGIAACQGDRDEMEDATLATFIEFSVADRVYRADLFGVFDGHGGEEASKFAEEQLPSYLISALEKHNPTALTTQGIWDAFKTCFRELHADYVGMDGTTATVTLLLENHLWVANVGDSRTILSNKGKAIQLSEDTRPDPLVPEMERYIDKIRSLGGIPLYERGAWRINGKIAPAGAIGDKWLKSPLTNECCVPCDPEITCYSLNDVENGYLILACDGLYDVASTDEVVAAVNEMLTNNESIKNMAKRLVHSAIKGENPSKDNVSIVIVKL